MKTRSPWTWVPSLYFAQGIPYVIVMTVAVIMYKRLGISNTDIALYTSWLYLPWVIKPFWSPFVDIIKTKRWWIVTMQLLIGAGLAAVAFLIPVPFFFQATLAVFWLMAFASATHDIAADGFYMLALDSGEQSFFVGIRSTFYRLAMIAGQGVLIILAGSLESATGLEPVGFNVTANPTVETTIIEDFPTFNIADKEEIAIYVYPESLNIQTATISPDSLELMKRLVVEHNERNGFISFENSGKNNADTKGWWSRSVSDPLKNALQSVFDKDTVEAEILAGNAGIVSFRINKQPEKGEEVVLNLSMDRGDKDIFLVTQDRIVFDETNWEQPALALVAHDYKLNGTATASFKGVSGNIPLAWSITFFILAGFFVAIFVYHRYVLPCPDSDLRSGRTTAGTVLKEFGVTFASFFRKPDIGFAIAFMLLYRLAEAMLVKMAAPFLLDAREIGGLGLTTGEVGFAYGTVGVIALTLGGILGGIVVSRQGLKYWILPMALSITLPNAVYLFLAWDMPYNLWIVNAAVAVEQFGYGFGFTAYMLYLIYISDGDHKTAHYALCTGFMALGMMLPGMVAGWLQEIIGYRNFFVWVMICTVPTLLIVPFMKIKSEFGRKKSEF